MRFDLDSVGDFIVDAIGFFFMVGCIGIVAFMVIAPLGLVYESYFYKKVCTEYKVVTSVGGCDNRGLCGVTYTDGSVGREILPSVGQRVCTKNIRRKINDER